MQAKVDQIVCHTKSCLETATVACDHCGRRFCSAHVKPISIQRRDEPSPYTSLAGSLARIPTHAEIYTLCPHCWGKPVPQKPPFLV